MPKGARRVSGLESRPMRTVVSLWWDWSLMRHMARYH